jgi:hypothetical protein
MGGTDVFVAAGGGFVDGEFVGIEVLVEGTGVLVEGIGVLVCVGLEVLVGGKSGVLVVIGLEVLVG